MTRDALLDNAPPDLPAALAEIRAALHQCEARGVSLDAVVVALLAEALPRLAQAYGPQAVAAVMGRAAAAMAEIGLHPGSGPNRAQ